MRHMPFLRRALRDPLRPRGHAALSPRTGLYAFLLCLSVACSPWKPAVPPLTSEQLIALTPESCASAFIFPSFDSAYEAMLLLLDRAAPDDVDIEVEAQVVTRPFAKLVGEPDAIDIIDIAMARGVDPALPIALYLGPDAAPAQLPAPDTAPLSTMNPSAMLRNLLEQRPFAAVLPRYSQKFMEQAVADWIKGQPVREEPLEGLSTPLCARQDNRVCWFFTPEGLVIGNSFDLVKAVAARRLQPAPAPTLDPEAASADIIQIVRGSQAPPPNTNSEPLAFVSRLFASILSSPADASPTVITWRIGENSLDATARRPLAAGSESLRLATLLPTDATAFLALPMSGHGHALARDLINRLGAQTALPGDALNVLESLHGELAIAATKGSPGRPNIVVLTQLGEGEARDTLATAASALAIETYNGVRIVSVPVPGGSGYDVQYALVGDVLAAATEMGAVKTAVDRLQTGKPSGLFASLRPPLDPASAPVMAAVALPPFLSDTLVPLLSGRGSLPFDRADAAAAAFAKIQDIRTVAVSEHGELVTRLTVRVL